MATILRLLLNSCACDFFADRAEFLLFLEAVWRDRRPCHADCFTVKMRPIVLNGWTLTHVSVLTVEVQLLYDFVELLPVLLWLQIVNVPNGRLTMNVWFYDCWKLSASTTTAVIVALNDRCNGRALVLNWLYMSHWLFPSINDFFLPLNPFKLSYWTVSHNLPLSLLRRDSCLCG